MLEVVTAAGFSERSLLLAGERIYNLERKFSAREGVGTEDTLPKKFLEEPMPEGPAKGYVSKLKPMLKEYYRLRGWVDGIPTKEKLKELGIAD